MPRTRSTQPNNKPAFAPSDTTSSTETAANAAEMRSTTLSTKPVPLSSAPSVGSMSIGSDAAVFARVGTSKSTESALDAPHTQAMTSRPTAVFATRDISSQEKRSSKFPIRLLTLGAHSPATLLTPTPLKTRSVVKEIRSPSSSWQATMTHRESTHGVRTMATFIILLLLVAEDDIDDSHASLLLNRLSAKPTQEIRLHFSTLRGLFFWFELS